MPYREDFGPLPGERPAFQDATANDPYLAVDPNAAAFAPPRDPWFLRKLKAMNRARQEMPQQSQPSADGSTVNNWASLGKGVGNLARKLIGMENGGTVTGPTLALIGEGHEPEVVLPESKTPSFVAEYLRTGTLPNPANLPRSGYMPPPPVILPPQQASERTGTRPPPPVILPPQMANGGVVTPSRPMSAKERLSPQDEAAFANWYAKYAAKTGNDPNPNDPRHQYDYRAYWKQFGDSQPMEAGTHLPDTYKLPGHPSYIPDASPHTQSVYLPPGAERTGLPSAGKAPVPQMANGGKTIPCMAQGGMAYPRTVESAMPDPMDYFNVGDDMVAYNEAPQFAPPPISTPRPQRPLPQMPTYSTQARERLTNLAAQGPPMGKWYERLVGTPPGDGPMDMRPGVAGYSQAGRALRGVLSNVLPLGRKREEFGRKYNAAQMEAESEAAQNVAGQKRYQQEIERVKAEDALETASSTRARNERQGVAAEAAAAKSGQRELKSSDFTNQETGDVTRVWSDPITGKEIRRETIAGVAKPKPTAPPRPQQPTAASLAQIASDPSRPTEERAAARESLKLLKPPKAAGGGDSGGMSKDEFSRMSRLTAGYKGEKAISILPEIRNGVEAMREAAARGTSVDDITLMRLFSKITDPTTGVREEEYRTMAGAQGLIDKVNLFASGKWTQGEQLTPGMRKKFVEVGNRIFENRKKQAREVAGKYSKQATAAGVDPSLIVEDFGPEEQQASQKAEPIVQHNKRTGAYRHSLDGGKTWLNGQPK